MSHESPDLTVVLQREIAAPTKVVFAAFSQREHLSRWFGPPGYPLTHCEVDFRVGGRYRFQMTGPDGQVGPMFGGEYLEIVEGSRIAYTNRFEHETEGSVVTVTFTAREDGGTDVRMVTEFPSAEAKQRQLDMGYTYGLSAALDQLAALAEGEAS